MRPNFPGGRHLKAPKAPRPDLQKVRPDFTRIPQASKTQQLIRQLDDLSGKVPDLSGPILDLLKEKLARDPIEPIETLREHFRGQLGRKRAMLNFGADIVGKLRVDRGRRLIQEILIPARQRRLTGQAAWKKLNRLLLDDCHVTSARYATRGSGPPPRPILTLLKKLALEHPNWTMGIGLVPEAGVGVGGEVTYGIAGMLHRKAAFYEGKTLGVGAYAELGLAIEAAFAYCEPGDFSGLSFGVDLGFAYGLGLTAGVAVKPKDLPRALFPTIKNPRPTLQELDCVTVGIPIGVGVEGSFFVDYTCATYLFGPPVDDDSSDDSDDEKSKGPAAPSGLDVSIERRPREEDIVRLRWTDNNSSDGTAQRGFYVERAAHDSSSFTRLGTVNAPTTTYEDAGVRGRHDYRVQAYRKSEVSAYSNVATWK